MIGFATISSFILLAGYSGCRVLKICHFWEKNDCIIGHVVSAEAVIHNLDEWPHDLIVIDHHLSDKNGSRLIGQLRVNTKAAIIRIIMSAVAWGSFTNSSPGESGVGAYIAHLGIQIFLFCAFGRYCAQLGI